MPRQVLRWEVPVNDQPCPVGAGVVVLVASRLPGLVEVWTDETEDSVDIGRIVQVFGPGHLVPDHARHLGSTFDASGPELVWHLFQVGGTS